MSTNEHTCLLNEGQRPERAKMPRLWPFICDHRGHVMWAMFKPVAILFLVSSAIALVLLIPTLLMGTQSPDEGHEILTLMVYGIPALAAVTAYTFLPLCAIGVGTALLWHSNQKSENADSGDLALRGAGLVGTFGAATFAVVGSLAVIVLFFCFEGMLTSVDPGAIQFLAIAVGSLGEVFEELGFNVELAGAGLLLLLMNWCIRQLLTVAVAAAVLGAIVAVVRWFVIKNEKSADVPADLEAMGGVAAMLSAQFTYVFYIDDVVILLATCFAAHWMFGRRSIAQRLLIGTLCSVPISMCWFTYFELGYVILLACAFFAGSLSARTLMQSLSEPENDTTLSGANFQ